MRKGDLLRLNEELSKIKIGKISKESAFSLLEVKIELSGYVKKIEEARSMAAENLKPAALKEKEGDKVLQEEWNNKFIEFMNKFLSEEEEVKLPKITRDDFYELSRDNNFIIEQMEVLNCLV